MDREGLTVLKSILLCWWWENVRPPPKLGRYWEIHPLCPRDFPRPSRFPSGFALGISFGSWEISWASGMDFPIPPLSWWRTDPIQCNPWPIRHPNVNPIEVRQSITNPPIQCQSITNPTIQYHYWTDPQIHQQSINPSPICQSITNPKPIIQGGFFNSPPPTGPPRTGPPRLAPPKSSKCQPVSNCFRTGPPLKSLSVSPGK